MASGGVKGFDLHLGRIATTVRSNALRNNSAEILGSKRTRRYAGDHVRVRPLQVGIYRRMGIFIAHRATAG